MYAQELRRLGRGSELISTDELLVIFSKNVRFEFYLLMVPPWMTMRLGSSDDAIAKSVRLKGKVSMSRLLISADCTHAMVHGITHPRHRNN